MPPIDDEGCNCTCHWHNYLMCQKCKGNHKERREELIEKWKPINAEPIHYEKNIL